MVLGDLSGHSPFYLPGEKMVFNIRLESGEKPVTGVRLVWTRTGDDGVSEKGEALSAQDPLVITTSTSKLGFVRVLVVATDENGKALENTKGQKIIFDGGAGVLPEKLESVPEPVDFDAYWSRQKQRLVKTPYAVLEMKPLPAIHEKVSSFDLKVACAGDRPSSGYFSKPNGAAPRSMGAQLNLHGYDVRSASRDDMQASDPAKPMLVLNLNAHGIENGRAPDYYEDLKQGALKRYGFVRKENLIPETVYFNDMVLRALRALEFLKAQPEWDGRTLIVSGGSQGAFQALLVAALDRDVSLCVAGKPWFCDVGGVTLGRMSGWRPDYTEALNYFDPVNHAKRIRCETFITAGLGDYVCPPSGVSVLYNNIPDDVPKTIEYRQGTTHTDIPARMVKHVISNKGNLK